MAADDQDDQHQGEDPQQSRQSPHCECRVPGYRGPGREQQVEQGRVAVVAECVDEPSGNLIGQCDRLRLVQPERGVGEEAQEDPDDNCHHGDGSHRGAEHA